MNYPECKLEILKRFTKRLPQRTQNAALGLIEAMSKDDARQIDRAWAELVAAKESEFGHAIN